ncbi:MAG TPA: (d)CMP kinase [Anaerolineaceae bacterium]|nr:(d)CMP kinase [Anaerolineaceae bacterium]
MTLPSIIAIDGPAASGKSTVGERLAKELGYLFFDTGVMYRAITYAAMDRLSSIDDEAAVSNLANAVSIDVRPPSIQDDRQSDVLLDGQDVSWEIRRPEVEANVSQVSAYPEVRRAMTSQQRRIGLRGNVVMAGRDIGTVVFPEAQLKIFLVASIEVRARRRLEEILSRGGDASYEAILSSLRRRDQIDSTRAMAPLKVADDAIIIDTNDLTIDEVLEKVRSLMPACS